MTDTPVTTQQPWIEADREAQARTGHPHPHHLYWRSTAPNADSHEAWIAGLVDLTADELVETAERAAAIEANGASAFDAGWYEAYTARVHGFKDIDGEGIRPDDRADYNRGQCSTDDLESDSYLTHGKSQWHCDGHGVYHME